MLRNFAAYQGTAFMDKDYKIVLRVIQFQDSDLTLAVRSSRRNYFPFKVSSPPNMTYSTSRIIK